MAEPVYVQAGANVEATDTFATWINTTNALVYDMGTKVLTTTTFTQPNTSVGGYVTGNSQIEGIFSANTLTATTALRGGTVSTSGNLNSTSNTIFADSNLVSIGANTDNFNVNANNMTVTSGVTINTAKSVNVTAANTNINSGALFVKTDATFTGTRVDIDSPVLDVIANTVFTAATLNANVDIITLGFNGSDALNVNSVADFNANVNIDGILTSTANAVFTGAQARFDNNVIIGSSTADNLTVNAYLASDLLPSANTIDLGSASNQYGNVHTMFVYAGSDVEAIGEVVLKGTAAKTLRVTGSNGSYQNLNITFSNNSVSNTAIVANTSGLFGGVNQLYSLGSSSVNWKDLYVQNSFVTGNEVVTGDIAVNGGDITTTAATFNLLETGATTLNAFGAATAIDIGANSGTITINNPTLVGSQTTQNVYNTVATTVNAFGAATTLNLGAATGTATLNNATVALNGGTVTTNKTTFTLLNTTATTVNAFGAATALSIGAATGNTTINNNAVITGDVAVNGGDITTSATTFNLVNGTATTLNIGGAATTLNIGNASGAQTVTVGGSSTANSTYNVATGTTASGSIKTVNVGTGAASGSTTNVNIGSSNGGTTTINSGTIVGAATTQNVFNTTATTVNAFGAATTINMGANTGTLTVVSNTIVGAATTQNVFDSVATTVNAFGAATTLNVGQANAVVNLGKSNGNTSVSIAGNGTAGTATLTSNVTTGRFVIAPSVTSGSVDVGSANGGSAKVLFTADSDALNTGALVVSGGAGIAKTLRVGNNAIVDGNLTVKGAVDFQGNVNVNLAEANTAVLKVTTEAQFIGTVGSSLIPSANNTYNIGSTTSRWNNVFANALTTTGDVTANNVTASSSLITGAFTVKSGNKDAIILDANVNGSENRTVTIRTPASGLSADAIVTLANGNTVFQAGTMAITGSGLNQFASTTSAELAGIISDETGTGSLVFSNSPTLVTPTLGVATATSINKVAITAPATSATLTIANGKTATINNTLTLSGTDGSTVALGAGGTVVYTSNKLSALSSTTSAELAGVISDETGSGALVFGTSPTFTTSINSGTTFSAFAAATTLTLGYSSTAASTLNISTGAAASATTKTINIGTGGAAGSITNINFGSTAGTGTATFNNDLVVTGNLIVNGTTSTINSTTISVDDKNIELGAVATPTNVTADGGGITLKGATDKTLNWVNATGSWTSSENIDLANGKTYKINTTDILSATALGSSVVSSSLTSVGALTSGTWNATTIGTAYGGTGLTSFTSGGAVYATSNTALTTGTLPAASGGTGQSSYVVGDLLFASTTTALSRLADVATGNALISGGVGVAPSWGKIGLTTHVSGILPIANGGTGQSAANNAFDALSPMTTLGDIIYEGVGPTAMRLAGNTTTTKQFLSQTGTGSASAAPAWSTVTKSDVGLSVVENTALSTWPGTANVVTVGTITTGTWNAGVIGGTYGGTGVNNGSRTITIGGNISTANSFSTSGNFALTLTTTAATNVTLPTTGTLATLAGAENISNKTITGGSINNTPIGATTASTGKFTTLDLSSVADTTTAASHYYVETATDGFIRPKTLANVQTEIVTANSVSAFAPTRTGGGASGTWSIDITGNANTVTNGVYTTGNQTISGVKTFTNAVTVDNGANTFTDFIQGRTGTLAAGNPMLFLKKTSNTTFTIGGYNGAATEGDLSLNFSSINTDAPILTNSKVVIRGDQPTMYFRDTNANSAMIHVNSNIMYVLRGGVDSETFTQVNGQWPLYLELNTNNAVFGGSVYAVGEVTAYSDERLKSNIRTIDSALDKVTAMRGVYFDKDGKARTGVVAQEVEKVLPEVISVNENDGYKTVAYGNIVGVLIEAIKELKAEIEELKRGK